MEPEEGLDWFRENGPPAHVLLSNRHHDRDSAKFVEAFGCTVHASRPGMHEFYEKDSTCRRSTTATSSRAG